RAPSATAPRAIGSGRAGGLRTIHRCGPPVGHADTVVGTVRETVAYAPTVERWLRQLANEGRLPRTLAAYRADVDDTMVDVASYLGLLAPRDELDRLSTPERDAAVLTAFERLDLRAVDLDLLDEARAAFRTRPDPRF